MLETQECTETKKKKPRKLAQRNVMCVCWGQETVASDEAASLFSAEATAISGPCVIASYLWTLFL